MTKRLAWFVIAAVVLITAGACYEVTKIRFNYEFEDFFPSEDASLDFYHQYMDKFAPDVDFVLVGLKNEGGIFDPEFLHKAKELREEFETVRFKKRVISPFDMSDYALGPFGPIEIPYLHVNDTARYAQDSARIYKYEKGVGSLFSQDGKSISMVIEVKPNLSKIKTDTVYMDIKDIVANYDFDEIHLAGKAIGQAYYIDQITYEFTFFFTIGVMLIMSVLILIYRSIWGVAVPLLVVSLSVIWLLGLMGLVGKPIDIMTALLPLVLFVVGISDVIHLLSKFFEEIRNGHDKTTAIQKAYKQVGVATLLTTITTALGFFTLVTSSIIPVKELGIYAAIGVFMAFILAFSLLPAILTLTKVPKLAYKEPSSSMWNWVTRYMFRFTLRNRWGVVAGTLVIVAISLIGISRVEIDNFLLEDMGQDDPHRNSFEFFEVNFAGARPFEMQIEVTDTAGSIFADASIDEMVRIERYLKDDYGVGFLISPLNILRSVNQAANGGIDTAYAVPPAGPKRERVMKLLSRFEKQPEFAAIVTPDAKQARFSGKIVDRGGKVTKQQDQDLTNFLKEEKPLKALDFELTGMAILIDANNETLSLNMMNGLIIAFAVVALIMGLLYRSFIMAIVSLIPNMLPLMIVGGVMGFTGIDLKVATSIIFGIAFGIAVDDSIHYLSKYRLERLKGRSPAWALRRTSLSTGKAIIITSLILCSGFLSLSSSDFTSTFYVGMLVSITLLGAVLSDLLLLPLLLLFFSRGSNSKQSKGGKLE